MTTACSPETLVGRIGRTSSTSGKRFKCDSHLFLDVDDIERRLGKDRIGVFTGDKDKTAIKQFMNCLDTQCRNVLCLC